MPSYIFECKKCKCVYEELTSYDERGKYPKVKCPNCKSKRKIQMPTCCNFNFSNPVGTDRWNSESSGHDYRYKHNQPNVAKQRATAEQKSHMGSAPYSAIDDISSGKNFGEVK